MVYGDPMSKKKSPLITLAAKRLEAKEAKRQAQERMFQASDDSVYWARVERHQMALAIDLIRDDKTTVREVADAFGMTEQTIYHHLRNME